MVLGSAGLWVGYQTVLMAAGIAVFAGASWWLLDKPTFDCFAGRLLRAWFRRWLIYQRQGAKIVFACNLVTSNHRGQMLVPLRDPSNTRRALREARSAEGFEWVTSDVFRKTRR
ncbi:hypothetical protein [Saccharopolyspora erythraea]|uniref:Uncharacterized protein n=2 Tax=Saccharopolyspora erythraea TaxID=1836 RepID=A4FQB7_SACEN|nr:hypothetical protein [Saccharopolyspora erythraea]EQD86313.1 hypothetical protein N599_10180 [Saccharopolyspora erythraea D]QRK89755.1 hypothetical protein JQX30_35480 [Saccharopolyspora erythraea]CAM06242.1 hypothetical protein SACE_7082 [Saccharopolyspora erythraea NRRL 2338]